MYDILPDHFWERIYELLEAPDDKRRLSFVCKQTYRISKNCPNVMLEFEFVRDNCESLGNFQRNRRIKVKIPELFSLKIRNIGILKLYNVDVKDVISFINKVGTNLNYTYYIMLWKEGLIDIQLSHVQDAIFIQPVLFDCYDIVKETLEECPEQLTDRSITIAMRNIIRYNYVQMMQLFMNYEWMKKSISKYSGVWKYHICTILQHVKGGRHEIAHMMLDCDCTLKCPVESWFTKTDCGTTYDELVMSALYRVCRADHERSFDVLCDMGLPPDCFTRDEYKAYRLAVTYGRAKIVSRCISFLDLGDILKEWLSKMLKCQESREIVNMVREHGYITEDEKTIYLKRLPNEQPSINKS